MEIKFALCKRLFKGYTILRNNGFAGSMKGDDMDCSYISEGRAMPWVVAGIAVLLFLTFVILAVVVTWLYCRIFSKAGYCWALGLLTLVPIVNVVMLCVLGLSDWPVLKELRQLKQQAEEKADSSRQGTTAAPTE